MDTRFGQELDQILLPFSQEHIILAVSGGVDSVVLAHLLSKTDYSFSIAHCNFKLRGKDSDADEDFVKELAKSLSVEYVSKEFDTLQNSVDNGVSIQMAARTLRYEWFYEIAKEKQALVATAHHANDTAETIIFNLAKGTGIAGFHGINRIRGIFIRPLLWASKIEIEEYAQKNKISWREDSSNSSDNYQRNLIRQQVVPVLEKINPNFIKAATKTSKRIRETEALVRYGLEQSKVKVESGDKVLFDIDVLRKLPALSTVLYELLKEYGFSYDQAESIGAALDSTGALFYSKEYILNIDRSKLILARDKKEKGTAVVHSEDRSASLGNNIYDLARKKAPAYVISSNKKIAALDAAKLKFPLLVRYYEEGDSFYPLGMNGSKNLSDFFIDIKMPVIDKPQQQVVVSGSEIVWVVGQRVDNRYKVTSSTKEIFEIQIKKTEEDIQANAE